MWRPLLVVCLIGGALLASAVAQGGRIIDRAAATRAALAALGVHRHHSPEIVFGAPDLLPAAVEIRDGGPPAATAGGRIVTTPGPLLARTAGSAWFFYEDLAPFQQYAHPGRVALVDARTGQVTVSSASWWAPIVAGRLPAFLSSQSAYDSAADRVFYRPYVGGPALIPATLAGDAGSAHAALDRRPAAKIGALLAAQHACTFRFSDTISGGYYEFARTIESRAAMAYRFGQLPGLRSFVFSAGSGMSPTGFVAHGITAGGCRDVLLYMAGGGYRGAPAVNIGMGTDGGHQDVTRTDLSQLIAAHPGVKFELVLDAARASGFQALGRFANVELLATPYTSGGGSITYLPEAVVGGKRYPNRTNPYQLLQLTDRLAFGFTDTVNSACEFGQLTTMATAGQLHSVLAYLLLRGFARGAPVDFAAQVQAAFPPAVQTKLDTNMSGRCAPVITARPDSYAIGNGAALSVDAKHGVLANDSDSAGFALTVNRLNGKGALTGTSAKGAAIKLSADGSFTYDPTTSAALRALPVGQRSTDSFSYGVTDGHRASATGHATITVTGAVHHAPVLAGIESGAASYVAGTPAVPVTSSLTVSDPGSSNLVDATVSIGSGFAAAEDTLAFANSGAITGSYNTSTGVLTLTGAASPAAYQAALRSVRFADSNGTNPSTATRTVSFQVNDGASANNLSNTVSRQITVAPNPPPTASDFATSTDKNTPIDVAVLPAHAGDTDGDTVTVSSVATAGTKGQVSINPNGTIHYDPNGQFNSLNQNQTGSDTFTYKVSDGFHESASATVTVTVTGVNSPPALAGVESVALSYQAGSTAAAITSSLSVSDSDDANLARATVSITAGFVSSEDALSFTNQNGITGSYNAATGVLTLSGTSTIANYQAALRSVAYSNSNAAGASTATRTVSFQVDDGHPASNLSNVASRAVDVTRNPAPTAANDSAATGKHSTVDINVLSNDSDSDGDTLSVASVDTTSTQGLVSINANGTIKYDPNGKFNGLQTGQSATDTFTYKASDGFQTSNSATVTVTINGSNDPPALANIETGALQYDAGTAPAPITSTLTATDDDDTSLAGATVTISSGFSSGQDVLGFNNQSGITGNYNPATGVLALSGSATLASYQAALRSVTFSDANGANPTTGTRTITFQVDDGHAPTNLSNSVSRDVTVNPNPAPVASNDSASTDKHTAIDISVLTNDSDSDGDSIHVSSVNTAGTLGSVSIKPDGTIHYDPNGQFALLQEGQTATDTFTYKASDGFHDSNSATVTVTINGSNDAPVLANIEGAPLSYPAGSAAVAVTQSLTASDADDTTLAGATVKISSGLVASEDSLGFSDQNGITGGYNPATGVLTLSGSASLADYQAALRSVTFRDANGATPTTGTRTISFQVSDGHTTNNLSNLQSRQISVGPNTAPTAVNDSASTDKHTAIDIPVLANDSDSDGDTVSVASVDTTSTQGLVSINSNGTIKYDPNGKFESLTQGQTASDTFTYKDSDGFQTGNSATVTVTINGVNDPPVLSNMETTHVSYRAQDPGVAITSALTISDPDDATIASATASITSGLSSGDQLQFTNQSGITGGYDGATGVLTLSGNASIAQYEAALHSIDFFTSDGSATPASRTVAFAVTDSVGATSTTASRTIDVSQANQPPSANTATFAAVGNTPLGVGTNPAAPALKVSDNLLNYASDPDSGGAVSLTGHTSPVHGTVTVNPDGTFTYVPNAGFTGPDSFTYTVTDSDDSGNPKSATGTVSINVGGMVWYVDNTAPAGGDGRSTSRFNTLASAESAPASAAGDFIYVFKGDGTNAGQDSGITLKNNQTLLSEIYDLAVGGHALATGTPANRPVIGNASGSGVTLGSGDTVKGFDVTGAASGAAISGAGTDTGGTIADDVLHGGTGSGGMNLGSLAGTWSISDLSADTTGGGSAISLSAPGTGTVTFAGTNSATSTGGGAFLSAGSITLGGTIGTASSSGAATAISVNGALGSMTLSGGSLGSCTTACVDLNGGSATFSYGGTISNSAGRTISVQNRGAGATFSGAISATGGTGILIRGNTAGTNSFTHSGDSLSTGANPALTITNNTGATTSFTGGGLGLTTTTADGVDITGGGVTTISGATDTVTTGSGTAFKVSGGTEDITSDQSISESGGHPLVVQNRTGGTVALSGAITDVTNGTGINLTSNTGATVNLTGQITGKAGFGSTAFNATGGGTVNAGNAANTLVTSGGQDLNVANTTIGSSGLKFTKIDDSSGQPISGPSRAISLTNTGSSGALTVTGDGATAGSGGRIQNTTSTGSATLGSGDGGIYLNNTLSPSLSYVTVTGNHASGIYGSGLSGLTLSHDSITANGSSLANHDDGIRIDSVGGTATVDHVTASGSAESNARIATATGASLTLNVTNSTFGPKIAPTANDGLEVLNYEDGLGVPAHSLTFTASGDTFTGNYADGLAVLGQAVGPMSVSVTGNTVTSNTGAGINVGVGSISEPATFAISSNTLNNQQGNAINVANLGGGLWTGHVTGNMIGTAGAHSGSTAGSGISLVQEGSGHTQATVSTNTVHQIDNAWGIVGSADTGAGTLELTMSGNTVTTDQTTSLDAIFVNSGANNSDTSTICLNASTNNATTSGTVAGNGQYDPGGLTVDQNTPVTTFHVQGYTGGATDDAAMQSYLAAHNTLAGAGGVGGALAVHTSATSAWTNGTCTAGTARDVGSARHSSGAGHRRVVHIKAKVPGRPTHRHVLSAAARHRLQLEVRSLDALARGGHTTRVSRNG